MTGDLDSPKDLEGTTKAPVPGPGDAPKEAPEAGPGTPEADRGPASDGADHTTGPQMSAPASSEDAPAATGKDAVTDTPQGADEPPGDAHGGADEGLADQPPVRTDDEADAATHDEADPSEANNDEADSTEANPARDLTSEDDAAIAAVPAPVAPGPAPVPAPVAPAPAPVPAPPPVPVPVTPARTAESRPTGGAPEPSTAPVPPEEGPAPEAGPAQDPETPRGRLWQALKPAYSRSQLLAGVLCALLGFALVAQVRHSGQDELASLRQDDLVRLLDDVTQRAEQLDAEVSRLQDSRDELVSGTDSARAALELAQARATAEGILSGRLPAEGPGLRFTIHDPNGNLDAVHLVNLLEELRNAGTEVAQVNGIRIVASSAFVDTPRGIQLDGTLLESPFEWVVIGDPPTIDRALEIPGGALPRIRREGATTDETEQLEHVTVDATVELLDPRFARPVDPGDA